MIDYTEQFQERHTSLYVASAQGKGSHFIALYKDPDADKYHLEYRWLSCECEGPNDEAYVCCKGAEVSSWSVDELKATGVNPDNFSGNLFEHFQLFP